MCICIPVCTHKLSYSLTTSLTASFSLCFPVSFSLSPSLSVSVSLSVSLSPLSRCLLFVLFLCLSRPHKHTLTRTHAHTLTHKEGWRNVRHLPANSNEWFQATDDLQGTGEYGDQAVSSNQWSVKFDESEYDEMMIMTGDREVSNILQHALQHVLQHTLQCCNAHCNTPCNIYEMMIITGDSDVNKQHNLHYTL